MIPFSSVTSFSKGWLLLERGDEILICHILASVVSNCLSGQGAGEVAFWNHHCILGYWICSQSFSTSRFALKGPGIEKSTSPFFVLISVVRLLLRCLCGGKKKSRYQRIHSQAAKSRKSILFRPEHGSCIVQKQPVPCSPPAQKCSAGLPWLLMNMSGAFQCPGIWSLRWPRGQEQRAHFFMWE